jgi:hypothetical protein
VDGSPAAVEQVRALASSAKRCSPTAHVRQHDDRWLPVGDPMEVALHVLAARVGRSIRWFAGRRRSSSGVRSGG